MMTEYEREKVRDLVVAMTEEEKEIVWEVLVQWKGIMSNDTRRND